MLMHALCTTISSVPSKHSSFCNYFRRGRRGLLREIEAQSQSISRKPVSITSRPDTKPLAQKTNTYLNILCKPKQNTLYYVSNRFILMLLNRNTTQIEKAYIILPSQRKLKSVFWLIRPVRQSRTYPSHQTPPFPELNIPLTKYSLS